MATTAPLEKKKQESARSPRPAINMTKFEMLPAELLEEIFIYVTLPIENPTRGI